jgi:hypothetical protein
MQTPTLTLSDGHTGSTLFRSLLADVIDARPAVFEGLSVPPPGTPFKRALPDLLCRFEARRVASPERAAIAGELSERTVAAGRFRGQALVEAIADGACEAGEVVRGTASPGWTPSVTYRGQTWSGARIGDLAERLRADHQLTRAAADALVWMAENRLQEPLVLEERFALLGAGAELAPTPYLLEAGATVLWIDRAPPSRSPDTFAGTIVHHADAGDLLTETPAIAAALRQACSEGPVHLGLYAYAPGKGRELLLTLAMNALADHCAPASRSMLVSPTTPGEVQPEDRSDRTARRAAASRWQRALEASRFLATPGYHAVDDTQIARSIVSLQGPTYLAAQYLTKMLAAEHWAATSEGRVSANVAGITHTASLEHPLFLAGFIGAPRFGVEIFTPEQTRVLSTLLMLHDLLNPDAPAAAPGLDANERARRVAAQSVHGGVRSLPWVFEPAIRAAAVIGLAKQPGLLRRLRT